MSLNMIYLQQAAAQGGSGLSFIIMMVLIFVVMWFFMIRPQQKRQKELNNLTMQQREVLYLKYYKKMSPEEIAQVMGLTSRTVYNTTHMAISSLRERMSKSFLLLVAANLWIFN